MRIAGNRIKKTRWIHTDRYVVAVEVEAVLPPDDPNEPCYESETVRFLREVESRARQGDLDWLKQRGVRRRWTTPLESKNTGKPVPPYAVNPFLNRSPPKDLRKHRKSQARSVSRRMVERQVMR